MKVLLTLCALTLLLFSCGDDYFKRGEDSGETKNGNGEEQGSLSFESDILPLLKSSCTSCHRNVAATYEKALGFIKAESPEDSELYTKATGSGHPGVWRESSEEAKALAAWILDPLE